MFDIGKEGQFRSFGGLDFLSFSHSGRRNAIVQYW